MKKSKRTIKVGVFAGTLTNSRLSACYRIFLLISEIMNFSTEIVVSNLAGDLLPNGTWSGIFGMLNRSEIDFAPIDFFMTEQRREAVYFSYPFQIDEETFVTAKPKYSSQVFAIFNTMSTSIWISIAVTIIIVVISCSIITGRKYSLSKTLLHVLAVLLKQPEVINPSTASGKVLSLSWMIGAMLLSLCYNSVLLFFLSFPPESGVRNVPELAAAVQKGEYNCMVHAASAMPSLLIQSNNKLLKILADNLYENPHGLGTIDDFLKLKGEKIAFLSDRLSIKFLKELYFISDDICLQTLRAMVMSKNFCCKREWERHIHNFMAYGIYQKIFVEEDFRVFLKKVPVKYTVTDTLRKLNLKDLSAAFIFLVVGYIVSILMLVVETLSHRKKKLKYSKRKRRGRKPKKRSKMSRRALDTRYKKIIRVSHEVSKLRRYTN